MAGGPLKLRRVASFDSADKSADLEFKAEFVRHDLSMGFKVPVYLITRVKKTAGGALRLKCEELIG